MPNISFYLSSQDVNIELGTDTILILENQPPPVIECDFTSTIEIPKSDLRGTKIRLNNPNFNITSPYPEDISIFIDQNVMMDNAFSNFSRIGNLIVDTNSARKERISKIFSYIAQPTQEQAVILDIVNQTYGSPDYISTFTNEQFVLSVLNNNLTTAIYNKNVSNINSMMYNDSPIEFQFAQSSNNVVNDTVKLFNDICNYKPSNLARFNQSNNYTLFLMDLLDDFDNVSCVVTYIPNNGQKTFSNTIPSNRLPTKVCIKIIIKDSSTTSLLDEPILTSYFNISFSNFNNSIFDEINIKKNWQAVSISASGQYQTAVSNSIYVSSDFGNTWYEKLNTVTCAISISASGKYQTAVSFDEFIYTSYDYGNTWYKRGNVNKWVGISILSSGKNQFGVVYGDHIYKSSNYGNIWSPITTSPIANWTSISTSETGEYLTAVMDDGFIYTSSDFGNSWIMRNFNSKWISVSISATGQYQTVLETTSKIHVSSDFGISWTSINIINDWLKVSISASGQYQCAVARNNKIYKSNDYGLTWHNTILSNNIFTSIAISGSGQYQTAVCYDGYIYKTKANIV